MAQLVFDIDDMQLISSQVRHKLNSTNIGSKVVQTSARNTKIYEIWEICRAIFSAFYNILRPNFAVLLISRC